MEAILEYEDTVTSKMHRAMSGGFDPGNIELDLFDWQKVAVKWACKKGRAALFEDCGLGKTRQQLAWAHYVHAHTGGRVIILAPLAVSYQTCREADKIGIGCKRDEDGTLDDPIVITNYERLSHFDSGKYVGIVLDESSIIKSKDGKTRKAITEFASRMGYRLACTATPSPNDHTELGTHAEFLGVCTQTEMLATYFIHDAAKTQDWRLKGHAKSDFWAWVASWAMMIRKPSDIGYSDDGYILPKLNIIEHHIESGIVDDGNLFTVPAKSLSDQRKARRQTMGMRIKQVADLANANDEQWLIWCEMNDEGDKLTEAINGAQQVAGATPDDKKESLLLGFSGCEVRALVTKPKLAGFGLNWQNCHNVAFVGLSHSWEQFYQAVRRCWRFGQKSDVNVHIVVTDIETEVISNIKAKQEKADEMSNGMVEAMKGTTMASLGKPMTQAAEYKTDMKAGDRWEMHNGDCVKTIAQMQGETVGYTVFSPPFASLYTYSDSPYDMGNCTGQEDFFKQFTFLIDQLYRVTAKGRLCSFHCMNLPTSKVNDGYIGIRDFRGYLIREFEKAGWIYHSEVCIWKDPVTAMQRTKALGLLHKQIRKDSSMSRQGIADYVVTMRKPGENDNRIEHDEDLPVDLWQKYASPVWMDINPSDTLQYRSAREHNDEKHICPLQLEVIKRCLHLWSKPDDIVLSPFAGIGSEGYMALKHGRRFIGVELKTSYYNQAVLNLQAIETDRQTTIFDILGPGKNEK